MPVCRVARETRDLQAENDARSSHSDITDESLKADAFGSGGARLSEIGIDDDDPLCWPPEGDGALTQGVLPLRALRVLDHLTE
jgi:hypothetical protein